MPHKPLTQCATPGCPHLVKAGRCEACRPKHIENRAAWRKQAMRWYTSDRWAEVKRAFRSRACSVCGVSGPGVVDHITPHHGNAELFWDPSNWDKKCIRCHNAKSAKERA